MHSLIPLESCTLLPQICKIFDVCLTILWTSGIEKLKCPMLAQSELELEFTD